MFGIVRKPTVLKPHKVAVIADGEFVVLTIGNSSMRMRYEDAIALSQWLRVRGKEAKRFAGDVSRHWHGIAIANGAPEVK
jgi:hypothetical protein